MLSFIVFIFVFTLINSSDSTGTGGLHFEATLKNDSLVNDMELLKDELQGIFDIGDQEVDSDHLEFYYFKLHDLDENRYLDGNELFAALYEADPGGMIRNDKKGEITWDEIETGLSEAVDSILQEADHDGDGLISWVEFVTTSKL